jgi:hypothetical protein
MKNILLFFILSIHTFQVKATPTLQEVRSLYQKTEASESACKELLKILEPYDEKNSPLFLGYKASANMMMAKHVSNPFTKLSYFKKGKKMMEKAINADKGNVELRSLRFAAQANIPSFLNYNDNLKSDKDYILKSYRQVKDTVLKETIYYFMTKWGDLTESEKQYLK